MSTRASILCKREGQTVARLYHHWDGYETGVWKTLDAVFCRSYKPEPIHPKELIKKLYDLEAVQPGRELEPADREHGDTEYLYIVNLDAGTITYYKGAYWDSELLETEPRELTRELIRDLEYQELKRWKNYKKTGEY